MNRQPTQIQNSPVEDRFPSSSREEKLQAALNEVAEVVASDRSATVKVAQLAMTLSSCEDQGLITIDLNTDDLRQ